MIAVLCWRSLNGQAYCKKYSHTRRDLLRCFLFEVHRKATGDYNKLALPDGTNQSTACCCIDSGHTKGVIPRHLRWVRVVYILSTLKGGRGSCFIYFITAMCEGQRGKTGLRVRTTYMLSTQSLTDSLSHLLHSYPAQSGKKVLELCKWPVQKTYFLFFLPFVHFTTPRHALKIDVLLFNKRQWTLA